MVIYIYLVTAQRSSAIYIDMRGPNRPKSDYCDLATEVHRSIVKFLADDHSAMVEAPEMMFG
jgi:hypothetical protein